MYLHTVYSTYAAWSERKPSWRSSLHLVQTHLIQTHLAQTPLVQAIPWTLLAVLAYIMAVTLGSLRMRGVAVQRRWHHLMFIVTVIITVAAAAISFTQEWRSAVFLLLALVPLALLPILTTPVKQRRVQHIVLGLCPAPFYAVALVLWMSPS